MHRLTPELITKLRATFEPGGRINAARFIAVLQKELPDVTPSDMVMMAVTLSLRLEKRRHEDNDNK